MNVFEMLVDRHGAETVKQRGDN
ncbi:uncharacterized protein METZ01_LOCUS262712 [marine metagenome]|uniref:Uncharacterized protein n=1 Tax=marine metagenome TaxID=408172 RepID=A0A382JDP4_9ZZZZ